MMWLAMVLLSLCLAGCFGLGYLFMWTANNPGELFRQSTQEDTGLRCLWCGKHIGAGRFCTGTHYNLFVARYGRQS